MFNRLAECRKSKGITARRLARMTNVSESEIFYIESGYADPRISTVCKIVHAMQVDADWLFPCLHISRIGGDAMPSNKSLEPSRSD